MQLNINENKNNNLLVKNKDDMLICRMNLVVIQTQDQPVNEHGRTSIRIHYTEWTNIYIATLLPRWNHLSVRNYITPQFIFITTVFAVNFIKIKISLLFPI